MLLIDGELVDFVPDLQFEERFPEIVDNSMRTTLVSCPWKFYKQYCCHYAPATKSVHLHAGGAFAAGIEAARRAFFQKGLPHDEAVWEGYCKCLEAYGSYAPTSDTAKTAERMAGAINYYFAIWPMQQDFLKPYESKEGKLGVEFSFVLPIDVMHPETGQPLLYYGRFDMLATKAPENTLWVVDEKTAGSLGESWLQQWDTASQLTGYCWGARKYGSKVAGAFVRGISILKNGYGHAQAIQYRGDFAIDQWYEQMCRDFRKAAEMWKEGYFDRNLYTTCNAFFRPCEFKNPCQSPEPERWLESPDYVRFKYDPTTIGKEIA